MKEGVQLKLDDLTADTPVNSEMWLVLIVSTILIFQFGCVLSARQCPFPGIPANSFARNERNESVTWMNRSFFNQGQIVKYSCNNTETLVSEISTNAAIQCRSDGTWNASLLFCGETLSIFFKKLPKMFLVPSFLLPSVSRKMRGYFSAN